jgi:hypothetical protein
MYANNVKNITEKIPLNPRKGVISQKTHKMFVILEGKTLAHWFCKKSRN